MSDRVVTTTKVKSLTFVRLEVITVTVVEFHMNDASPALDISALTMARTFLNNRERGQLSNAP